MLRYETVCERGLLPQLRFANPVRDEARDEQSMNTMPQAR